MLSALNEVRLCYVMEKTGSSLVPSKRESSKVSVVTGHLRYYYEVVKYNYVQ